MVRHKFVSYDPDKCVGCRVCEYVCSLEKEKAFNPTLSRIRTLRIYPNTNASIACRLCEDAPCVIACPRKALEQSKENGVILVDDDKCDGCGWCIEACDFGTITLMPDRKTVVICDLCEGEPKCVKWCPEEALELSSKDIIAQKARIDAVQKLTKAAAEAKT
ncbi:MAG: 4Fe-4S dicluster domain-containing protein [Aigarchaeota archaeon]|nr:4Fe-4S dicluster domain-containing protein [Aigarchaeota archaeon]